MKLIKLEEFETLRGKEFKDLAVVHDNDTQKNYYVRVDDKDKNLESNKEFVQFVEENCFVKINNSTVRLYWK